MSKFHEKVEGRTKQIVGQMIGDHQLVREGKTQERKAEADRSGRGDQSAPHRMAHSDQGIVKDQKASEQPKDKERAQRPLYGACSETCGPSALPPKAGAVFYPAVVVREQACKRLSGSLFLGCGGI